VICTDEVPNEHQGVPGEEAAGHQRLVGQPNKVLARGVVETIGLFQGKYHIKKEKFNLNIHDKSVHMTRTVHVSSLEVKYKPERSKPCISSLKVQEHKIFGPCFFNQLT
jgi:hypothetical protein